jgi:DNA-directed RNA polymerase subunit RPC12/RpoP
MQGPAEKRLDPTVSPLFVDAVHDRLRAYDGRRVGDRRPCPGCGSRALRKNGYQRARKTFARLVTEAGFEEVGLEVQLYECKGCGQSFQGDLSEWFYPRCEYARPIVELCRFHAADHTYSACERLLERRYGLQVDRDTVERYDSRFTEAPDSRAVAVGERRVSLTFLAFLFGEDLDDDPPFVIRSPTALW